MTRGCGTERRQAAPALTGPATACARCFSAWLAFWDQPRVACRKTGREKCVSRAGEEAQEERRRARAERWRCSLRPRPSTRVPSFTSWTSRNTEHPLSFRGRGAQRCRERRRAPFGARSSATRSAGHVSSGTTFGGSIRRVPETLEPKGTSLLPPPRRVKTKSPPADSSISLLACRGRSVDDAAYTTLRASMLARTYLSILRKA